ncbi:MAG TPA: hypothetical protein PK650_12085 [Candidatus Sumerlaeota bacterium]|nr:hypothetical protein [Candidatus Sumerlaeota bacterium]
MNKMVINRVRVGNNNVTANISNCDLITASATGSGINVMNDSGKTIRLNIVNCRSIKSDYTPMPLFYPSYGTGTTAYIANCQYSALGNANVTVNYLASSAINTSAVSIGAAKFTVDANGNITKVNNVTTSFPSSQGDANTYLKNDGSGNLSWAAGGGGGATGDIEVDSIMVGTAAVPSSGIGSQGDIATSGILRGNSLTINGTSVITSARALQNVTLPSHNHAGTDINSGTVADARLSSNIPKKDSVNAFTNFVSIEKTATENLLTLTGGTITTQKHVLKVTGTMPATADPGTFNRIVEVQATSGNSGRNEYPFNMELRSGGTASCFSAAGRFYNERAGTGALGFGSWGRASNNGIAAQAAATTSGYNYGGTFDARGGDLSVVGGWGATNI